jgi:hypothetical protein
VRLGFFDPAGMAPSQKQLSEFLILSKAESKIVPDSLQVGKWDLPLGFAAAYAIGMACVQ